MREFLYEYTLQRRFRFPRGGKSLSALRVGVMLAGPCVLLWVFSAGLRLAWGLVAPGAFHYAKPSGHLDINR